MVKWCRVSWSGVRAWDGFVVLLTSAPPKKEAAGWRPHVLKSL